MNNNPKSTKDAPPDSPTRDTPPASETAPFTAFANLFQKGLEGLAELQKTKLDLMANQTAEAIGLWRQAFAVPSSAPGAFLFDLASQGAEKAAQCQKVMIDMVVQQSSRAIGMSKEHRDSGSKWTQGADEMVRDAADTTVAVHKIWLDFAAEQNKTVAAAVKRQAGVAGSSPAVAAVDTIQRNMDMAIQTQRELMEAAAKPLKAAKQAA